MVTMNIQGAVMQESTVVVGLGEVKVSRDNTTILACLGLGSCVGISAYDPQTGVGGMAHIVLTSSSGKPGNESPKYADIGVPMLLKDMRKIGASIPKVVVKIAGGAQMSQSPGLSGVFKIGEKNVEAVLVASEREGIRVAQSETGGHNGRTLRVFIDSGKTVVSRARCEAREL
jgi:chemotaxis protein CheD